MFFIRVVVFIILVKAKFLFASILSIGGIFQDVANAKTVSEPIKHCDANCMSPRRPFTEDLFVSLGHHESTPTDAAMNQKLLKIKKRRGQPEWNSHNPAVISALKGKMGVNGKDRLPNILMILVDDLGYGDLSVHPFVGKPPNRDPIGQITGLKHGIDKDRTDINWNVWPCESNSGAYTPNLERLASNGVIMSNFHSASPVCSPSRVAIMTGLYPWRLGALNAFELGRDLSQRNGFLPQVPTGPEILRQYGYYTGHSGKWHLGGMREEQRLARANDDNCEWPSPNQHGFETYISELDGPESPRYTFLLRNSELHSKGYRFLLKDDVPMPISKNPQILSDREASDAIAMIKAINEAKPDQPWYIQVWFNAPHGPWEVLQDGLRVYSERYNVSDDYWNNLSCGSYKLRENRDWQYKTMISAMDASIGKLMKTIDDLNIAEDTIIVFHSDNGPEQGAGNSGPYKEKKRSLLEGGIRVPAIWQWKGRLPSGGMTDAWGGNVDIFPTLLEAAGLAKPENVKWDGISLLAALEHSKTHTQNNSELTVGSTRRFLSKAIHESNSTLVKNSTRHIRHHIDHPWGFTYDGRSYSQRLFLWHKDTEVAAHNQDRVQSSAVYDQVKVMLKGTSGCLDRIFDLKHDPYEDHNMIYSACKVTAKTSSDEIRDQVQRSIDPGAYRNHCQALKNEQHKIDACAKHLYNSLVNKVLFMLPPLFEFVKDGNYPMLEYATRKKSATCLVPTADVLKPVQFSSSRRI
jgi:arylsulfatase A-like enzyme